MLLVASYAFYGSWDYRFLILLFTTTLVDYIVGISINGTEDPRKRKLFLFISIFTNLAVLGFFKYFNFFAASLIALMSHFNIIIHPRILRIILPVGISFYTFQSIGYVVDVYRREIKPAKRFLDFALFVSFFPQLVAGPIQRARHLLPQVLMPRRITVEGIGEGLRLTLWGLFKKIVVADRLGIYVDAVYGNVYHHSGLTFVVGTFFFAFQIYCDFSGYSDIARGIAKLMGFDITINFNNPYFAKDIREFWQRWHISLSTWLRDYLYIPLGGNRKGALRSYVNVFITMLLGGLWHGASWTFVFWGGLHGSYIVITKLMKEVFDKVTAFKHAADSLFIKTLGIIFTFCLVLLTWIFFRASNLNEALYILKSIIATHDVHFFVGDASYVIYGFIGILFVVLMESRLRDEGLTDALQFQSDGIKWAVAYLVIFAIILFGVDKGGQFIYFQF